MRHLLLLFLPTLCLAQDSWEISEGTPLRWCVGEKIVYAQKQPKDGKLCPLPGVRGSYNRTRTTADFSAVEGEAKELTLDEKKKMARDIKAIQQQQAENMPQDMVRELEMIARQWKSDPKFREEMTKELGPFAPMFEQQLKQLPELKRMLEGMNSSFPSSKKNRRRER